VKTTEGFIGAMFTPAYSKDEVAWVIKQNLKLPREYAARLLYDHATRDWRRIIPRINIPTLVVGGKASLVASPFMWKKKNGAFFRLVKCTTSRPPWQAATGGTRREKAYQQVGRSA